MICKNVRGNTYIGTRTWKHVHRNTYMETRTYKLMHTNTYPSFSLSNLSSALPVKANLEGRRELDGSML